MKRSLSIVLALLMILSTAALFASCGKKGADSISVCLASEPDTIDPALNSAVDGATMIIHAFSGLVGYRQDSKGALELFADCATTLPTSEKTADGKTSYTFTLRSGLKWSDGSELTAEDFIYAWNRAADPATASDYGYMFDVIDGYAEMQDVDKDGNRTNPNAVLNATADGNKITIVLTSDVPYFFELLAFPTYMPVKKSVVEANKDGWATDPSTYVCNGAYTMTEWVHDSKIVYTKNENYHNASAITVKQIVFYLSDDSNNMLANFKNGTWQFIDDVPTDEIATLQKDYPTEYHVEGQLGTYYVCFNINKTILPATSTLKGAEKVAAESEIRQALALLLDRNYIVEKIGQAGQVPASSFVAMGLTEADGKTQFYQNTGFSTEYTGYYDTSKEAFESNCAKAVEILKKYYKYDETTKKFTDAPSMTYLYNTSEGHKKIGEYIQQALGVYGFTLTLENQEWNTFLNTRKDGDYTIARNGWLGDYNDPISFLDMWITASGNNDVQFGKGDHKSVKLYSVDLTALGIDYKVENATWAETYDYIINLVKTTSDADLRYKLMHKAEDLLMETGAIVPLYYYTDIYMCSDNLTGVFASPLGYKFFMYASLK